MLSIWSSSFFFFKKKEGKVARRKKKKNSNRKRKENEGLKRYMFSMSIYKGKYIGFSPFSNAKMVWHA